MADRNVNFVKMAGTEKWLLRKKEAVTSLPHWALDAAKSYSVDLSHNHFFKLCPPQPVQVGPTSVSLCVDALLCLVMAYQGPNRPA